MSSLRALKSITRHSGARSFHASARTQRHFLDADFATFKQVTTGPEAANRVVIVDFYAEYCWCGPCKMLTPVLKELTEGDEPNEHLTGSLLPLDLMTINVDSEEGRELAARYKVHALPTVSGFLDGKLKASFTGALRHGEVLDFLKTL